MSDKEERELLLREMDFLNQIKDSYKDEAEGAQAAFEAIAAVAIDVDDFEQLAEHIAVLESHCHLDDKPIDFWHGEKEFYKFANKFVNSMIDNVIKERRKNNGQ